MTQKTTFTNSVEKSAGYQLEEAFSRENQISIESSTSIGVTIKGVLDVSTSLTVGSSLSLSNSQTNSSNLSKAIKAESSDEINIPPASVVYYFTKWKERKNKVVVAYDGINWPYTATTDIKPAGDAVTMIYWKNDEIAPGLKTYASGEPIPEEVFQEIHAYHAAYYDQKDKPGGVVTGTTGTTNTTNLPPTSGNTASANNTSVVKCTDRNGQLVGYFMKLEDGSNNWVEKDTDGHIKFTYQETGKEDHAIHLYDSGRDVDICLQLNLGEVLYSDANNTTPFSIFTISEAY